MHGAFGGEVRRSGWQHRDRGRRRQRAAAFRETEVEQFGARLRQHDVARFQIAMHDAGAMGRRQRAGDLDPLIPDA
jgi:hypothetical protein